MGGEVRRIQVCLGAFWDQVVFEDGDGTRETLREAELIDAFAAELARRSRLVVEVTGLPELAAAPEDAFLVGDGFLLDHVRAAPAELAGRLLGRTVLLGMTPAQTPGVLAELGLAAGVEDRRYFAWRTVPDEEYGGGLFGRKPVVAAMGGEWRASRVWETADYCLFHHDGLPDLPAALAPYLDRYAAGGPWC